MEKTDEVKMEEEISQLANLALTLRDDSKKVLQIAYRAGFVEGMGKVLANFNKN